MTRRTTKNLIFFALGLLLAVGVLGFASSVLAQNAPDLGLEQVGEGIGLPTTDVRVVVAKIIRAALGLLGIVAVVLIIYGGFIWMTAGGNEEKITQAKKILINAGIGLIIILSAYGIVNFVVNKLLGATTGTEETGGGGGGNDGGGGGFGSGAFYVKSLPQGGVLCIRNVHLSVDFSREVDLTTLAGRLVLLKGGNTPTAGRWVYGENGANKNTAVFVPEGDCGDGIRDCLEANTNYSLHFNTPESAIKSLDGKPLQCSSYKPCSNVVITTGEGVDRQPPAVTINYPDSGSPLGVGDTVPVNVGFTDDNGVQSVKLRADGRYVDSARLQGCKKAGQVTINWPTAGLDASLHRLITVGEDWSGQTDETSVDVTLKPPSCFNHVKDPGEEDIDCGLNSGCGLCEGGGCTANGDCASGYCEIPSGDTKGVCVNRMMITDVSPLSGGPGSFVSVAGNYFGSKAGRVYFSKTNNPNYNNPDDWIQGNLANCGGGFDSWTPWQIIVELPQGAQSGPIKMATMPVKGKDGKTRQFVDLTNDSWGPILNNFEVTSQVRPGLCGVTPEASQGGGDVLAVGRNLGAYQSPIRNKVNFGGTSAQVDAASWNDVEVRATVPILEKGTVGVKVVSAGVESNSVRFAVMPGVVGTAPRIMDISPDQGAPGEYLTIRGENFGELQGEVWFKLGGAGEADLGDFNFPAACKTAVWSEKQIIVKVPAGLAAGAYSVQVVDASNQQGAKGPMFNVKAGAPNPGICKIDPVSGPLPFAAGNFMKVTGEYFGDQPVVFFWKTGASPASKTGRLAGGVGGIQNLSPGGQEITVTPHILAQTGPVVVYRQGDADDKISNPLGFEVWDCVKNNGCNLQDGNGNNYKCCASGAEVGVCRPPSELCAGETRSTGYLWRFSTKDIPPIPRVIERCDQDTERGLNLPSPSPSALWGADHKAACRNALLVVEFNVNNLNPIGASDLVVQECDTSSGGEPRDFCAAKGETVSVLSESMSGGKFVPQISSASNSYLELYPANTYNNGKWKDGAWYQVTLKSSISSGVGPMAAFLAKDKPCENDPNSAYCFIFKTGAQDCKIKQVVITPYKYWTSVLEAPMTYRPAGGEKTNLFYKGHGLSDQRCILMDVKGFAWNWTTANDYYSQIFSGAATRDKVQVSALANTVAVGLGDPKDAVNVHAEATTGTKIYPQDSPLTIDLSNPKVTDYWPKCLEACANAEVAVKFNTTMSNRNLNDAAGKGSVQLLKCLDENCVNTEPAANSSDIYLDQTSNYTILKIANSQSGSAELATGTLYKVVISARAGNLQDNRLLWSAASYNNPASYSKPFNQEFTWRFRTKKDACKIDRVKVLPNAFYAYSNRSKTVYAAEAFSSPDTCNKEGQKLNPWSVSWNWSSSDNQVAYVSPFTTKGRNPYCTAWCVRRGAEVPAGGTASFAVCGNGVVEAGEDCDPPGAAANCGLNCLKINGRNAGSNKSTGAQDTAASICGNGFIGSNEDCDLGIAGAVTNPQSALGCSDNCLHLGTRLSTKWCFDNKTEGVHGGFTTSSYLAACAGAYSQCGDKVANPDEDPGCDDSATGWDEENCNGYCLRKVGDPAADKEGANNCDLTPLPEGCDATAKKHVGSSLLYSAPSVCGDGAVGLGEDAFCEDELEVSRANLVNPWTLATAVGIGPTAGDPPSQQANILGSTIEKTKGGEVGGSGKFIIPCGYQSDVECQKAFGPEYGVGANSCCFARPNLVKVYPGSTSTLKEDICPNTFIEATFDKEMDENSLAGNMLIARGVGTGSALTVVGSSRVDVPVAAPAVQYQRFKGLQVAGNYAYAVDEAGNLRVYDISDKRRPVLVGSLTMSGAEQIWNIALRGSYLYFAGKYRFGAIDVSNPRQPVLVAGSEYQIHPNAEIRDFKVMGDRAYLAAMTFGTHEINIALPASPTLVASGPQVYGEQIDASGDYLYTSESIMLERINVTSRVSSPPFKAEGSVMLNSFPGGSNNILAAGDRLYSGGIGRGFGVDIYDISVRTAPHYVTTTKFLSGAPPMRSNLFASGNYLFVAVDYNGLNIIDVSVTATPKFVGRVAVPGEAGSVFVEDDYAYVTSYDKDTKEYVFNVIDVSSLKCSGDNDITALMTGGVVRDAPKEPWYKQIIIKAMVFVRRLLGFEAAAEPVVAKWCVGRDAGYPEIINNPENNTSKIRLKLTKPLAFDSIYAVLFKPGVRDKAGVGLGAKQDWKFATGGKICEVNKVTVTPDQYYYSRANTDFTFEAQAFSSNGQQVQSVNGYAWEYLWGPKVSEIISFVNPTATTTTSTIKSQNRNGETDAWASASITDNQYTATRGLAATGRSHLIVFLCENPWPPKDLYLDDGAGGKNGPFMIFPYQDKLGNNDNYNLTAKIFDNTSLPESPFGKYFNFSTYYCADNGSPGTADDLPYLRPAVQISPDIVSVTTSLKRFILSSAKNDDGIGIQVFSNPEHLSAREWFNYAKKFGGQGFAGQMQDTKVDGYDALTDGNNVYVDAANISFPDPANPTVASAYTNIYLFSINANAKDETRQVFNQLLNNLKFNINLSNYGYCGKDVITGGVTTTCKTDLDCPAPEVCAVQADKFKRNYRRQRDVSEVQRALLAKAPKALSVWHFDEGQGASTTDFNGGNNGNLVNMSQLNWTEGKMGGALKFDGSDNYVKTIQKNTKYFDGAISVEGWFKAENVVPLQKLMTYNSKGGGSPEPVDEIVRIKIENSRLKVGLWTEGPGSQWEPDLISAKTLNNGEWYHFAYVFDGAGKKAKLYLNGALDASANYTGSRAHFNTFSFFTFGGGYENGNSSQFNFYRGALDEIRVYNRALSPLEVKDHYYGFYSEGDQDFPKLNEGTYLPGQTVSTWPSWSVLGSAIGRGLPVDPINQLGRAGTCAVSTGEFCTGNDVAKGDVVCSKTWCAGGTNPGAACNLDSDCGQGGKCELEKCALHDAVTGWSTENRRFSFACDNPSSYAYRYEYSTSTGFIIYHKNEGMGFRLNNDASFSSFVDADRARGEICKGGREVTTLLNTACGDGRVTAGKEECDPPGKIIFNKTNCTAVSGYKMDKSTCDNTCHWQTQTNLDCKDLSKTCGNGKLDPGEACDDGVQNGTYNHCAAGCLSRAVQRCGDGTIQQDKEVCDIASPNYNGSLWAPLRKDSCNYDCQSYGPYCGDKIVQSPLEDCDGSSSCSVGGKSGQRICSNSCQKTAQGVTEQWRLEDLVDTGVVSLEDTGRESCLSIAPFTCVPISIPVTKKYSSAVNDHKGYCVGSNCPELVTGKFGQALSFDGVRKRLEVPHDDALMTSTFSVEVWVKPDAPGGKILEKADSSGGYGLYYNSFSNYSPRVSFGVIKSASNFKIKQATADLLPGWNHLVGTFNPDLNGELKLYVNGKLDGAWTGDSQNKIEMTASNADLVIGAGGNLQNFFKGSIDQVSYYSYVLNADEVADHYKNGDWFCSTTERTVEVVAASCGDGKVDEDEACDQGAGKNGAACNPQYNMACSYCSADCKQRVEVQPKEFCGNGIIEGTEVCDTDPNDPAKIYVRAGSRESRGADYVEQANGNLLSDCEADSPSLTYDRTVSPKVVSYSISKGDKKCVNNCAAVAPCARCGNVEGGAVVSGRVANVLYPPDNTSNYTSQVSNLALLIGDTSPANIVGQMNKDKIGQGYYLRPKVAGGNGAYWDSAYRADDYARLGSDPICSAPNGAPKYKLMVNQDDKHLFDFPIVKTPLPEQYDLVLSPVMIDEEYSYQNGAQQITVPSQDGQLRVVISWTGWAGIAGGFLYTKGGTAQDPLEGMSFGAAIATGTDYYSKYSNFNSPYFKDGIWYHGFGWILNPETGGRTNEEAFTLKEFYTDDAPVYTKDKIQKYDFYIRSFNAPIASVINNKLKVEVYKSENKYTGVTPGHMAKPFKTFYLYNARPSDNANAKIWYVFSTTGAGTTWSVCGNKYPETASTGLIVTELDPNKFCP